MPDAGAEPDLRPDDLRQRVSTEALRIRAEVPIELLVKIEKAFSLIAPRDRSQLSPLELIDQAEQRAIINPDPPVTSRSPIGRFIKQSVRKLAFFYIKFVTDQFNEFSSRSVQSQRALNARLDILESQATTTDPEPLRSLPGLPFLAWTDFEGFPGGELTAIGRALVLGPVDNGLVAELAQRNPQLSVYGVGIDLPDHNEPEFVRSAELAHLHSVAPGSLVHITMFGVAEGLVPGDQTLVADLVLRCLAPHGNAVLMSLTPAAYLARQGDAADTTPSRPVSPGTWSSAFIAAGSDAVSVQHCRDGFAMRVSAP